eukprot:CAMPEP_0185846996 /NCGR_PEP_ID=MMETSP1354-20130828/2434_1 /TAXON_ID=708628 /ORGANISM="Erythrolobus madagascarensis, Strain CCMP3276" /LENGTH=226 /DNA_ID=CAMNT_0028547231 /DNA_START=52 /DNA_END=729 /DNA_ORIENTATION=+
MAYRSFEERTPAYLEEFLQTVDGLPPDAVRALQSVRELDAQQQKLEAEGEALMKSTIARSRGKQNNADAVKRVHADFSALQKRSNDLSAKKTAVLERLYDRIDGIVRGLDVRLTEFEEQLRRDGRWRQTSPNLTFVAGASPVSASPTNAGGVATTPTPMPALSLAQPPQRLPTTTASMMAGARASGQTVVIDDMIVDPNEPRYCLCNQVSYGEMVACENDSCPHEW